MKSMITIPFSKESFSAYRAYASDRDGNKHPGLILIHEVWGLNDHVKDVAGRLSREGYNVLAPDLLSQTGITEKVDQTILAQIKNPATRDEAQKKMRAATAPIRVPEFAEMTVEKLKTCASTLFADEQVSGKAAVIGFCFGGTYSYALAAVDSRLSAAVPYYGHAPDPLDKIKTISCPILAFYGENDVALVEQLPEIKEKMLACGKNFEVVVYPNTGHAFFNNTNPATYDESAAQDSWIKTLTFLEKHLRS